MRKIIFLPVLFALFTACSSPLLEWIEAEPDTNIQIGDAPGTPPGQGSGTTYYSSPSSDKAILSFSFGYDISVETDTIRENPSGINGTTSITVIFSAGSGISPSDLNNLTPTIKYIGKSIYPKLGMPQDFTTTPPPTYRVTAENGSWREYEVTVIVKEDTSAEIKWFDLELPGGSMAEGVVDQGPPGTITIQVPSGTPDFLTAKIVQTGKTLTAPDGTPYTTGTAVSVIDKFSGSYPNHYEKLYKVISADSSTTKTYTVIVDVIPSSDTGINFQVYEDPSLTIPIPNSHVVIATAPRPDGKIPIVIQVPNGTNETAMYARITLGHPGSSVLPGSGLITFTGKEAVYTVTAENDATQQYVAVVSEGPKYYYVDGVNGEDNWPDVYNGGSEYQPFKTLAYAVKQAAIDGIPEVRIMGDLSAQNTGDSAFAIDLSGIPNKTVTIASSDPSVPRKLSAVSLQRVLSITGGAKLTFRNINVTGGNTTGDGGGIYVTGDSTVNFSGNITGNRARSGGGVYVEGNDFSTFTLTSGSISNNTAIGDVADNTTGWESDPAKAMGGGGGVYIKGNATFTLGTGGTISNNTTKGAGGGVLVNGNKIGGTEYGLIMNGGTISGNRTTSSIYPHGGGGVYVAHGAFDMLNGEVTGNTATRQGGGVFVHWGDARFTASGTSKITGNEGVGSSKDICNRGITALLGNVTTDRVYIWDYGESPAQSFTVANNVKITTGIALARSYDKTTGNKNFITLVHDGVDDWMPGTNTILIDLESHLEQSLFAGNLGADWPGQKILDGDNGTLTSMLDHFTLNTFTGTPSVYSLYNDYKIVVSGTTGTFVHK